MMDEFSMNRSESPNSPIRLWCFENQSKQQKSIAWVEDRLGCEVHVSNTSGNMDHIMDLIVFDFKKFFKKFINSIDPSFDQTDIVKASYRSKQGVREAVQGRPVPKLLRRPVLEIFGTRTGRGRAKKAVPRSPDQSQHMVKRWLF